VAGAGIPDRVVSFGGPHEGAEPTIKEIVRTRAQLVKVALEQYRDQL